ncbi:UNVERIFIED_CONTAM: hypothetical protein NCL1_43433 [Trichonephila clavipes]
MFAHFRRVPFACGTRSMQRSPPQMVLRRPDSELSPVRLRRMRWKHQQIQVLRTLLEILHRSHRLKTLTPITFYLNFQTTRPDRPIINVPVTTSTAQPTQCPPSNCGEIRCPYGIEESFDTSGCSTCRCSNPCETSYPVYPEDHMVLASTEIYSRAKELIYREPG